MDRLRCMEVFVEIARHGSFAAAAEKLNMSRASVTKHVASLENAFKEPLLSRTTRSVGLTSAGAEALDRCQLILDSFESMMSAIQDQRNDLTGLIKVEAPPIFAAKYLVPQIAKFSADHPGVEVSLTLLDSLRDFSGNGSDIFVGFNHLGDAKYTSVDLIKFPQVIVASKAYLRARGRPSVPRDLEDHNCLVHTQKAPDGIWRFANGRSVSPRGTLRSNHGAALKQATVLGTGISMFPYYFVEEECLNGVLEIVLEDFPPAPLQFSAVCENKRVVPVRVRRFIESLRQWSASETFPTLRARESRTGRAGAPQEVAAIQ